MDNELGSGQFLQAHGSVSVKFGSADADFGPETEFIAITGEP